MNKFSHLYYRFETIVSHVKFAVVIISLFLVSLVFGTFMESFHGADYANRIVYKSWWFILIEFLMFISIFMATVVRLPIKKRLYGFYVIHSGLIILSIGSFFTYINGIDGSLQLMPNTPARKVLIDKDLLKIHLVNEKKSYTLAMPYSYGPAKIDKTLSNVKILEFLPYAENKTKWITDVDNSKLQHSSSYMLFNQNVSQGVTLSLSPKSDFKSMQRMGLLNLHYMPSVLEKCFTKESKSGFVIWNLKTGECYIAEDKKVHISKTDKGTRFLIIPHEGQFLKFFPDYSPVSVNDDLTKNPNTPYRVLSKNIFQDKPNLFLFGENASFYNKISKKWELVSLKGNIAALPWMNFKLRLIKHSNTSYPAEIPQYVVPVQENGNIIIGNVKAVKIEFYGKQYYVRNDGPLELSNGKEGIRFELSPKEIKLPYQITLDRFQMNKNPGTDTPASFESFVQLLDGRTNKGLEKHHVFMNNPLKYDAFTFYQSSYFPVGQNQYASVLSVNYDPGRFFKYLGCLLVILGSIWHYVIIRKKPKVKHD